MIGGLRTRLGLYARAETPDAMGGMSVSWPFVKAVWGHIQPQPPRERFEHGRNALTRPFKITIRYFDGFPDEARLLWGERKLRVLAASDPDGRRERLHLICEEEQ